LVKYRRHLHAAGSRNLPPVALCCFTGSSGTS
jgi:hypothetical protein